MPTAPKQLITLDAAAEYLDVSACTVRRMIGRGELIAYRVGKRLLRIDRAQLEASITPLPTAGTIGGGEAVA